MDDESGAISVLREIVARENYMEGEPSIQTDSDRFMRENTKTMNEVQSAISELTSAIKFLVEGGIPQNDQHQSDEIETDTRDQYDYLSIAGSAYSRVSIPEDKLSESNPKTATLARTDWPSLGSLFDQPASCCQEKVKKVINNSEPQELISKRKLWAFLRMTNQFLSE
eukprot:gene958-274_t